MEFSREQIYLIRSYSAGIFVGYIKEIDMVNRIVVLTDCRRLWYWDGACSISEIALNGVSNGKDCKFSVINPEIIIFELVEIIPMSEKARLSIKDVKIWTRH